MADDAIKLVFSNNDFQEKLAQQNPGVCRELWALLGVPVVVVKQVSVSSPKIVYQAFGVSPADVSHVGDPKDLQDVQSSTPEIRPDCDGAQPAAAAFVPDGVAQSRRRVVNA